MKFKIKEIEVPLRNYCVGNYKCPNCSSEDIDNINAKAIQYGMDVPTIIRNHCHICDATFNIKIINEMGEGTDD